jgi:pyruvate,water dikinase
VAEIDLGVAPWGDDPRPVFDALANYAAVADAERAPEAQFERVRAEAERTASELIRRAARRGRWRGLLARFLLDRSRRLAGLRESPKFHIVLLLRRARRLLSPVGEELAAAGRLDGPGDVFFLTLPEARAAVAGADVRQLVRERRASYAREQERRHIPRLLLSDGTEPGASGASAPVGPADNVLRGAAASAGTATGRARVLLDPRGARLQPGDILVAPSTDPGWTPLFMTAGGLVMEMGGPMSHGAIVAREYGIPAVVGVPGATERIRTGETVSVDGTRGVVTLQP